MPDKHNENKIMAMLERKGIIRKSDAEDGVADSEPSETRTRPEADIRALFDQPSSETMNITPASRQPVPGISTPVRPSERTQSVDWEMPRSTERDEPIQARKPEPVEPMRPRPAEREQPRFDEFTRSAPVFAGSEHLVDDDADDADEMHASSQLDSIAFERQPQQPPAEHYTERYLDIDELYEALALKAKRTDTIYLVEEYLNTLPDSLPDESRRDIVGKIVSASGFDYDLLMGDGVLRVKMLKDYAERFARHTDDYVLARQAELDELDQQILRVRRLIDNRRELHKKQFFAIEAEAQRLKEILTFISG